MNSITPNILLVDKPSGITSFDVIRHLRKKLGIKKMGHAGTLDPLATGLMIIGINEGTKLLTQFLKLPKTYEAEILLGIRTDSGDITGKVVKQKLVTQVSEHDIQTTLTSLIGSHQLPVPTHSAIKVHGVRLYTRAHKGEENIETPKKEMTVTDVSLTGVQHTNTTYIISCVLGVTSGTYIRSIAEEFGKRLGYPATIQSLRRTRIGAFNIGDAEQM